MTKLLLTIAVIIAALFILDRMNRSKQRRTRDAVRYPALGKGTDADVEKFVAAGRKMTAIKLYREIHNVDLKSAKEAVEEMAEKLQSHR